MWESTSCLYHSPEDFSSSGHLEQPETTGGGYHCWTDANAHLLGQYGGQREKSNGWSSRPTLPASSPNQLHQETNTKWDPESAVPSGSPLHMSLLGWPAHGCDSHALKYSFLIQLLNLVFSGRNRDLFQHQKINWKKPVVGVVEAPTGISKGMPHQPERLQSSDKMWPHSQSQLVF